MQGTDSYAQGDRTGRTEASWRPMESLDGVRADSASWITPGECSRRLWERGQDGELRFAPLIGGPGSGGSWMSVDVFEEQALPHLVAEGSMSAAGNRS